MPRLFLHIRTGDTLAQDPEGQDYASLAEARNEAIEAAREIMSDRVRHGQAADHSQIEIMNEAGQLVHTVTFEEALKASM